MATATGTSLREKVDDLNRMILEGKILEAFDKYYADDVVMVDPGQPPREGKAANREYEEQFVNGLEEFREAEVRAVAVDEASGVAMAEWLMDFRHSAFGDVRREQVSVQHWKDGQIVRERFYYDA